MGRKQHYLFFQLSLSYQSVCIFSCFDARVFSKNIKVCCRNWAKRLRKDNIGKRSISPPAHCGFFLHITQKQRPVLDALILKGSEFPSEVIFVYGIKADALVSDCRIPGMILRAAAHRGFNQDVSAAVQKREWEPDQIHPQDQSLNREEQPEWAQLSRKHWISSYPGSFSPSWSTCTIPISSAQMTPPGCSSPAPAWHCLGGTHSKED